ncbi:hypothetical protein AMTR_s00089p00067660 [Amborella trichopoda]|uniref:Uncharacterized protein n=1 Tax=Amborella trichopoda TaxID=13333 RepID=W1P2G0_AMBTC|nr:hypothetical protein AMTR_s00089p00067660 [Amborella trichopoda]
MTERDLLVVPRAYFIAAGDQPGSIDLSKATMPPATQGHAIEVPDININLSLVESGDMPPATRGHAIEVPDMNINLSLVESGDGVVAKMLTPRAAISGCAMKKNK